MTSFERTAGKYKVIVECSASLAPQAGSLLDTLEKLAATPKGIGPDTTVQFGWAVLKLKERGGALHVVQPDYAKDPSKDELDQLDEVLVTITEQVMLVNKLGVSAADVRQDDTLKGVVGWTKLPVKLFVRKPPLMRGDSGWRIASPDDPDAPDTADDVEYTKVFRLLESCRAVFPALALPPGFSVLVDGDHLGSVLDAQGNRRGP